MRIRRMEGSERAVTEVIGVVMLIGVVVLGISAVVLIGAPAFDDGQKEVEVAHAEQALVQFSSEASRVTSNATHASDVDLGLRGNRGTLHVDSEEGNITIEYSEGLTGRDYIVKNQSMGTMTYEHSCTTVAYQGGGVWRSDGDGSKMVSQPDMEFRENTLSVPIVVIENDEPVHTDVRVTPGHDEEHFPNASRELYSNQASTGTIFITIESEYYEAWARYFDDQAHTFVHTPEDGVVEVIFYGSGTSISADAGVIVTSGSGEFRIEGSDAYIDSYNSSEGPYDDSATDDGAVMSAGYIETLGGSQVRGNVDVDATLDMWGGSLITGNVSAGDEAEVHSGDAEIEGSIDDDPSVPRIPPLDPFIEQRGQELSETNDNNETAYITPDNELDFDAADEIELGPGEYYLNNIVMEQDETLIMNTREGNVTVFVEDYVVLDRDGPPGERSIEVEGEGNVRLLMGSNQGADVTTSGVDLEEPHLWVNTEGSEIAVENHESHRFQILGPSTFRAGVRAADIDSPATVTAMIVAPTPKHGNDISEVHVRASRVYGTSIAGEVIAENNGQIHFDHATSEVGIPFDEDDPLVEFLYVSQDGIEIKES